MSSRAPLERDVDAVGLTDAVMLIRRGAVDAVLVASGRGDRRVAERTGLEATAVLAKTTDESGIPSVLLSTTRVLEGTPGAGEDAPPSPLTAYAGANAANEGAWLEAGGKSILRITNYFCAPTTAASGQLDLLPWSLVTEALTGRTITVRSGPSLTKEFVGAADLAAGVGILLASDGAPRICATVPGSPFTMNDLCDAVSQGLALAGRSRPMVTFGPDTAAPPRLAAGWLSSHGWKGSLTLEVMAEAIATWVRGSDERSAVRPR